MMKEEGQDDSASWDSVARDDDNISSSSYNEVGDRRPQHIESEDAHRRYRPHRTMFVSEQSRGKPPSPSEVLARSRSSSQSSITKRSPRRQKQFGDDVDSPHKSRGIGDSSHGEDSRSTDDSSNNSELDVHSGHSLAVTSGIYRRSSMDSSGSRASSSLESTCSGAGRRQRRGSLSDSGHNSRHQLMNALRRSRSRTKVEIPPAFRDKTTDSDNDASSTGTPRSRAKEKIRLDFDDGSDVGTPITRNARRGRRKPKFDADAPPPPMDVFTPRTRRKIDSAFALQVNFVCLDGEAESDIVSTFNALLEEIAFSEKPQVQKALDILATMKHKKILPDQKTWELIERCARFGEDSITSGILEPSSDGPDHDFFEPPKSFSLYSRSPLLVVDESHDTDRRRTSWKTQQDLSQLPPAFRTSIMKMLREQNSRRDVTSEEPSESQSDSNRAEKHSVLRKHLAGDSASSISVSSEGGVKVSDISNKESKGSNAGPKKVSERKKRWLSKGKDMDTSISMPIKKGSDHDVVDHNAKLSDFQSHGVVQYRRPDGWEPIPRPKAKSILKNDPSDAFDIFKEIERLDPKSLESFHALLQRLANSDYIDKAKQAGVVLKAMKEIPLLPDKVTKMLLAECSRIIQSPRERKVHEVDIEVVEETTGDDKKGSKKKVRFSNRNSTRIIRRRRSISSTERWDEPLTPPKRVTGPVDLAQSRFSSGPRDHQPAPPRRSDSLSSLISTGSASMASDDSDTLDGTISTVGSGTVDSFSGTGDIFKPPFVDSPGGNQKKGVAHKKTDTTSIVTVRRVSVGPRAQQRGTDFPATPAERRGSIQKPSAAVDDASNINSPTPYIPLPPPVTVTDFITPPSRPRIKRRGSIGGTEHRAAFPLTPPRRVSAPLDIFIAQSSLVAKAETEAKAGKKRVVGSMDSKWKEVPIGKETAGAKVIGKQLETKPSKANEVEPKQTKDNCPEKNQSKTVAQDHLCNSTHSLPSKFSGTPKSHGSGSTTKGLSSSIHAPSPLSKHAAPQSPGGSKISATWKPIQLPKKASKRVFERDTIESTSTSFDSADSPSEAHHHLSGSQKSKDYSRRGVRPWPKPSSTSGGQIRRVSSFVSERDSKGSRRGGVRPKIIPRSGSSGSIRRITSLAGEIPPTSSSTSPSSLKAIRPMSHSHVKFPQIGEIQEFANEAKVKKPSLTPGLPDRGNEKRKDRKFSRRNSTAY